MSDRRRWMRRGWLAVVATALAMGTVGSAHSSPQGASNARASLLVRSDPTLVEYGIGVNTDAGDALRANVTNLNATNQKAQVTVYDARGGILGQQTFNLAPGASGFFDVFNVGTGRQEVRGTARVGNLNFRVSLEVFDAITRETAFLCPSDPNVGKSTVRSSPLVGMTSAQTARIAVANVGNATETGTVTFVDIGGFELAKTGLTISGNQIAYFDYSDATIKDRLPIRALVSLSDANFSAVLELFDTKTGRTDVYCVQL